MLFSFSNRRRAKDSIMLILDRYGEDNMTVFVQEEMVYVDIPIPTTDIGVVMHYAEQVNQDISDVLSLDDVTELYKGHGIKKFRI